MIWVRSVLSAWAWLELVLVTSAGLCIQAPVLLLTCPFDPTRKIAGRFTRVMAKIVVRLNPMWRFRIHGDLGRYRATKTVMVSNHVSNADSLLICMLPWEMKWLAKSSLFKVPLVGWSMWLAGDIAVARGDKGSVKRAMDRCAELVSQGMPVAMFPEGTRSKTGELLPFRDGAFRLALETGAEVLPVAVAGTRRAAEKHSWRFDFARALLTVGKPISTEGMSMDDLEELKAEARRRIEELYATIAPLASS